MVHPVQVGKRTRMSFAKVKDVTEMPNLIEVQLDSYEWFLKEGLLEVTPKNTTIVIDESEYVKSVNLYKGKLYYLAINKTSTVLKYSFNSSISLSPRTDLINSSIKSSVEIYKTFKRGLFSLI